MFQYKLIRPTAKAPQRATDGSAGFDLFAVRDYSVPAHTTQLFEIGVIIALADGWCGQILPRSSLALNKGIDLIHGLIDTDYRGELKVHIRTNNHRLVVKTGDRIAQLLVTPYATMAHQTDNLDSTIRGDGGFGSTGT